MKRQKRFQERLARKVSASRSGLTQQSFPTKAATHPATGSGLVSSAGLESVQSIQANNDLESAEIVEPPLKKQAANDANQKDCNQKTIDEHLKNFSEMLEKAERKQVLRDWINHWDISKLPTEFTWPLSPKLPKRRFTSLFNMTIPTNAE